MGRNTREKIRRAEEIKKARSELDVLRTQLGEAYRTFNQVSDPEMMDACIYEISARNSRYNCALRNIKLRFM